ncbi:MAG: penicillin-binding transpeptidase domain-containing protein [Bacteroidales bacterium]
MPNTDAKFSRRFIIIAAAVLLACAGILYSALVTIVPERSKWLEKVAQLKAEDKIIPSLRGNIFASDGRLMASSIPQYYVYMDFKADGLRRDSLMNNLTPLCRELAHRFGERSAAGWRSHILKGYNSGSRHYRLIHRRISYTEMKDFATLPLLKYPPHKSGVKMVQMAQRKKPFGSLASRTVGDVYGEKNKGGKNGLELAYDSLLRGSPGIGTRQKIAGRYYTTPEVEPVNGVDITTTIDIDIQDITQTALMEKLLEIDAESGTAVVMEVKTGEIKAISNLGRISQGRYEETKNFAVSDESEPGSTFKVASMIVALDKGIINPNDTIDVGNGIYMYKGARMTDHNWHHGGYGKITAAQSIWYSSNIGVAKIILKGFENNPSEYVEALYDMNMNQSFDMKIPGSGRPKIRHPKDSTRYWARTSLPWMSFGYETQIPPIYTLAFFNAIANDGEMMKPYFVKNILKDGNVIEEYNPETINSSICKRSTLKEIRKMLEGVVEEGTAKMLKSDRLKIAGKTGTAQISKGKAGYQAGGKSHQVSFCGYFPAEKPIYSCIVVIRNPRIGYPSGGGMSGMVFKHIAERTYAQSRYVPVDVERDSTSLFTPQVKNGQYKDLIRVLDKLDIPCDDDGKEWKWTTARIENKQLSLREYSTTENLIPSVIGMGAKDALFLLESCGLRVQINGKGRVYSQSRTAGQRFQKGETIVLNLK